MSIAALLITINLLVNSHVTYVAEPAGQDNWQNLERTAQLKTGDCEDYAIAKRELLIRNGVPASALRLIYTESDGVPHMVLGYYPTPDATPQVLDNMTNEVLARDDLRDAVGLQPDGTWMAGVKYAGVSSKWAEIK